jgi:phospholipid transport system substrate-binding protein
MIKKLLSIIFALTLLINNVLAIEADIFVQSTVNRASQLLSENITKEEKIEKLKLIAKDTVDIEGIGFYTLGSARKDLNDDQKKEYSVKFEEYFLKSFSSRLAEYTNPEIDVFNKEILNENYTIVNSILKATSERPEVKIDWRIYTKKFRTAFNKRFNYRGIKSCKNTKRKNSLQY